jgi:hypothetical protein
MAEEVLDSEEANVETTPTLTTEETSAEGANTSAAEEKKEAGEAEKGKDTTGDKPEEAPETYDKFTLPDGMEMTDEQLSQATEVFKDLALSQEQAQKLVDFETKLSSQKDASIQSAWDKVNQGWVEESKTDSEFGGDKLTASLVTAKAARDAYGNDKFTEMLEITGVGNHPEMIRFLTKVGKDVSEDQILQGRKLGGMEKDAAKTLFPDMN